jgi:hypothetical protein
MLELQFFSWHSSKIKLVGAVLFGDLTVRGKRMDGRLCGLRHHPKNCRTFDHRFGDTISSWPTWLRSTRNKFDESDFALFWSEAKVRALPCLGSPPNELEPNLGRGCKIDRRAART